MNCPRCGKDCLKPAEEVMANIYSQYLACPHCAPEPNLPKTKPLKDLPKRIDRCENCSRATLDAVMLDVLNILVEHGLRTEYNNLRNVGSPLIAVGYPLAYSPRLGPRSLILSGDDFSKSTAEDILKLVPEVKGIILNKRVSGILDINDETKENVLLAGCDFRCDIVQSLFGDLVIYKSQSQIHIEFARENAPKIRLIERLYMEGKLTQVVDGLCGPGTLGLVCALAGAERVVLNDAWQPAIENVLVNLDANRDALRIDKIERIGSITSVVAREPALIARALGDCEIEVYQGDLSLLFSLARPGNLCLIDHFPGARTSHLEKACRSCNQVVIV